MKIILGSLPTQGRQTDRVMFTKPEVMSLQALLIAKMLKDYFNRATSSNATLFATLIMGFIPGPAVSLRTRSRSKTAIIGTSEDFARIRYFNKATSNRATILATLIIGLIAGPAVSL